MMGNFFNENPSLPIPINIMTQFDFSSNAQLPAKSPSIYHKSKTSLINNNNNNETNNNNNSDAECSPGSGYCTIKVDNETTRLISYTKIGAHPFNYGCEA